MDVLEQIFQQNDIDVWGICEFDATIPLIPTRNWNDIGNWGKRIIVFLIGYYIGKYTNRNISRYALGDDYHTIIREVLDKTTARLQADYPQNRFLGFVDNGPIPEIRAAYNCGLGDIGLNNQLLSPVYGSYCFIAEIVTDMELAKRKLPTQKVCTQCGRCIAACPAGALQGKGFDVEKCRSYITQKKGSLNEWETLQIRRGGYLWGCDCCIDACPQNQNVKKAQLSGFYENIHPNVDYENLHMLYKSKAYGWRGKQVLIRNLDIISKPE